jgi:parvulin-like peptidyl-prolyl isomerase
MKYIYYIAAILACAFALSVYQFAAGKSASHKQPAIIINDRVITADELAKLRPPHDESRQDFINSIITKELLIQEAQRSGIDKEETFRRSIQSFYEQSLVKVMMDRKFASLDINVGDEEVEKYYSMLDKKVGLTIYTGASAEDQKAGMVSSEKMRISFGDLSRSMKRVVSLLRKGEKSAPFVSGGDYTSIMLDDIQPGGVRQPGIDRDSIRKLIAEEKREQLIAEWMDGLRKKAKIKVPASGTNGG